MVRVHIYTESDNAF